jgi:hypothetical protein
MGREAEMDDVVSGTHEKALRLNHHAPSYGAFAEIGAGQEVSRWFFLVGGAANTVAKSTSAYDMAVSDSQYGKAERYVSRQRLEAMLQLEFDQLVANLGSKRGADRTFFAFADTVATRRHGSSENGRGWVGIRFQTRPLEAPSQIIIHAHLLDKSTVQEQQALGVLGVNLIYGAFFRRQDLPTLIGSLMDDLTRERIEVDMIKVSGPAFENADNRLLSLELVERGLTDAAMFTAAGEVVQPSEVLYKKPILVERGSFRPPTKVTIDILDRAREQFLQDPEVQGGDPVVLAEMTLHQLMPNGPAGHEDFLARANILHVLGVDVLISSFGPYYQLADYLAAYTDKRIGIAVGLPSVRDVTDEKLYGDLSGGALESIGRLFKRSVRMYVYPTFDASTDRIVTIESAPQPVRGGNHIRDMLLELGRLVPLRSYEPKYATIRTPDVLALLQTGNKSWEDLVPPDVAQIIKEQGLFGYRA